MPTPHTPRHELQDVVRGIAILGTLFTLGQRLDLVGPDVDIDVVGNQVEVCSRIDTGNAGKTRTTHARR